MPIPTPKKEEKQKEFIERCMSNPSMVMDYSMNQQRLAICYLSWKESKKWKEGAEAHSLPKNNESNIELTTLDEQIYIIPSF